MTELSEISDYSPFSQQLPIKIKNEDTDTNQIRCPICSSLVNIIEANFRSNFFSIKCPNKHKDNFINFNSFSSFCENVLKNIENILCNNCKNSKNETSIYRCNNCYLFFCEECKINHENNLGHMNYININEIDYDNINNTKMPKKNEINKEYHNIKNNIDICNKFRVLFNEWINKITKKFNDYMLLLNNYLSLEKIIVSNLIKYYDMEEMNINKTILQNYEILYPNKYFINNYIQSLNGKLNSIDNSFKESSLLFIKIIQNFDEIEDYFQLNQKSLDLVNKSKSENLHINNNKINLEEKISDMKEIKFDLKGITCFNSLMNDKLLLLGTKEGNLYIYEINQKKDDEEKLIYKKHFQIFENAIKNICSINNDIIIFSEYISKGNIL